jgi:addiction module HigA family antidote
MRMFNPPHPGEMLREDVLPALGVNVTEAAGALGVSRITLSRVLKGKAGISPEMALRIERWLGVDHGGRAGLWLDMQSAHDLWHVEQKAKPELRKVKAFDYSKITQDVVEGQT